MVSSAKLADPKSAPVRRPYFPTGFAARAAISTAILSLGTTFVVLARKISSDSGETPNPSVAREGLEENMHPRKPVIAPGAYTTKSLPPLSDKARSILDRVFAVAPLTPDASAGMTEKQIARGVAKTRLATSDKPAAIVGIIGSGHKGVFYRP